MDTDGTCISPLATTAYNELRNKLLKELTIQAKWKEELVVTCDRGEFSIDLTMGTIKAFFPDQNGFDRTAPDWARGHWQQVHDALEDWCAINSIPLVIEPNGRVHRD